MKFTLEIDCDLPSMQINPALKVAAVLAKTAADLLQTYANGHDVNILIVRDSNNNAVGRAEFE
jgi:hypothetical protein